MRRLRRAYQRNAKKQKKLRRRAVTAGTIAAITIGTGAGLSKAIANNTQPWQDEHQLIVSPDADADLLAEAEEFAIGYQPFNPDQNKNEIPDGVDLARRCSEIIENLPWDNEVTDPNQTYKWSTPMFGLETCETCSETVNMGPAGIVNPRLNLSVDCPLIAMHYLEHGSFSYSGDVHEGRLHVAALLRALEIQLPYDPNEHQLPLKLNDFDKDLMSDNEELDAGYDLYNSDQNENLIPDGIDLAQQCAEVIESLPEVDPNGPEIAHLIYKESFMQRGLEYCDICGQNVNMGYWIVTNSRLRQSIEIPVILLHYMEHGSFSYSGDVHGKGRVDVPLLKKILEMPQRCGDLGTIYLPADTNKDCIVDINDFAAYIDIWLEYESDNTD
jgi:hypothetical protein